MTSWRTYQEGVERGGAAWSGAAGSGANMQAFAVCPRDMSRPLEDHHPTAHHHDDSIWVITPMTDLHVPVHAGIHPGEWALQQERGKDSRGKTPEGPLRVIEGP